MQEKSYLLDKDFAISNIADDLVSTTLRICGNKSEEKPRYPRYTYDEFVNAIIRTAMIAQEQVIVANRYPVNSSQRKDAQELALQNCVYYNHLMRISYDNKWISTKQRDSCAKLCSDLYWKIFNWKKSDASREG